MGKLNGQVKQDPIAFEKASLEVAVEACRTNADVRRSDGRKSTALLLGEEVLRLRGSNAMHQGRIQQLNGALTLAIEREGVAQKALWAVRDQRDHQFKSRWFRVGLRLGFYY